MMAFSADALDGQINIDNDELLEADWFTSKDLPNIPPEPSLSNLLIKRTINSLL
jgi:NAD+ diphosphatase